MIQGDGIDKESLCGILVMLMLKGFSTDNIVFGSGGGLLQKFNRDTCKFAIKASYGERMLGGQLLKFDISKSPVTSKSKKSKAGMLKLVKIKNGFNTACSGDTFYDLLDDELEVVFENGEIMREQSFAEIRELSEKYLELEMNSLK